VHEQGDSFLHVGFRHRRRRQRNKCNHLTRTWSPSCSAPKAMP
jgi:hypothetical protein